MPEQLAKARRLNKWKVYGTMEDHNKVRRPIRPSDFLVLFAELAYNLSSVIANFFESILELSVYNSNRKTEESQAWEQMAQDLETLEEDR